MEVQFRRICLLQTCWLETQAHERTVTLAEWDRGALGRKLPTRTLDHIIALNEAHLWRLVREYVTYYNEDRIHTMRSRRTVRIDAQS